MLSQGGDANPKSDHSMTLPAMRVTSVHIPPLVAVGRCCGEVRSSHTSFHASGTGGGPWHQRRIWPLSDAAAPAPPPMVPLGGARRADST